MNPMLPSTAEEYMTLARQYAALADAELTIAESLDERTLHTRIAGLVSIVNVVGYMRTQDGFFRESRPSISLEESNELYALEDKAEARLVALIEKVCATEEGRSQCEARLSAYYLQARLPN